jgi:hypothetical protein
MDDDLHLLWDRESLEALLRKIVSTGETTKVDDRLISISRLVSSRVNYSKTYQPLQTHIAIITETTA